MAQRQESQAEFAIAEYTPRASTYELANGGWHCELADDFISWIKPVQGQAVLDLACGTGLITIRAADKVGSSGTVVGIDITPAMLEFAREKQKSQSFSNANNAAAKIDFIEADIASPSLTELPSIKDVLVSKGGFDLIICCSALILLSDPQRAVAQWGTLLVPNGRLVVDTPTERHTVQHLATDILSRHLNVPIPFSRAWITDRASVESTLTHAGLEIDETITTRSYLPETEYDAEQGGEVFEKVVLAKYGREFIRRGIVEEARRVWMELWEKEVQMGGKFRDGHWLYVCIGRKQ